MPPATALPHPGPHANFDRLARIYRALEFLAFGRDLERCRFCFLDQLAGCQRILVLGEGDGRCLARLVQLAPAATIHCVDASAGMLARAQRRVGANPRITYTQANVLKLDLPLAYYDGLTTLFLLDCFSDAQVAALVPRLERSLTPDARWLFADFVLPPSGWRRVRAQVWLAVLYAFFRWQTGLAAHALPDSEALLGRSGLTVAMTRDFQHGLLRSAVYARRRPPTAGSTAGF